MRRCCSVILCVGMGLFAVGCPKGQTDYSKGRKAETIQDYDAALEYYQKAAEIRPQQRRVQNQAQSDALPSRGACT